MKKVSLVLSVMMLMFAFSVDAQSKTETVKVYGNCGMCRSHIQKAAKEAGATIAKWNEDTKVLSLTFDESKTSSKKIQEKIAASGYDTQDATASEAAYKKLDECCQYDRKKTKKG